MKPVWDKPNPVKKSQALSAAQKAKARARARSAGRPYPNMVDNIWAARNEEVVVEGKAATALFRAGNKKRAKLNAMSDEERRAYDKEQQEKQRKRDDARLERERQKLTAKKSVSEAKEADYGGEYQNMVKRVGEKAKQGKMKTIWVADKYGTGGRYKVVPVDHKEPVKEETMLKSLKQIVEAAKLHPMALHVKPVKTSGGTKYQVHAVGKDLADGIKVGEHLTDTHLDDAAEMGAKIKHVKESVEEAKKDKKGKHDLLSQREPAMKQAGTDESVNYTARFMELITQHGHQQKLAEWHQVVVGEETEHISAIKKNIATRKVSTDKDTDIIRDYDVDDVKKEVVKQNKHHHNKVKNFRTYNESISSRMALSKAADMEFKAANTDDPAAEEKLKGKAKALKRAARLAQRVAGTVNVDVSKLTK